MKTIYPDKRASVTTVHQIAEIYDRLIEMASKNVGGSVKMEWGVWKPTKISIRSLKSRRNKLYYEPKIKKI